MFGFSLQKILLLAAIIGAVWYGFKMVGRLQERQLERNAEAKSPKPRPGNGRAKDNAGEGKRPQTEEMVRCPVCDAYVASRVTSDCGRPNCPY